MELRLAGKLQREQQAEEVRKARYGKTTIKAVGDAIVCKPVEARDTNDAGLVVPDRIVKEMKRGRGIVLDIGPGPMVYDGVSCPMPDVKIGDEVVYNSRLVSTPDGDAGYEFHIVPAKNICGVIIRGA